MKLYVRCQKEVTFLYMLKTLAVSSFHFITVSLGVKKNKTKPCEGKETNLLSTNSDLIYHDMT